MSEATTATEPREGRCGARLRNSERRFGEVRYCAAQPAKGRSRCRLHGGASPRGGEHPRYQGRGYSRDLPTRLADRMRESLDDPHLTSLLTELALVDARLGEILGGLDEGEHGAAWSAIRAAHVEAEGAFATGDQDAMREALGHMSEAIYSADADKKVWDEAMGLVGERRKLADVERKREEQSAGTLTSREALAFVAAIQAIIMEEVRDDPTRLRMARRLSALMGLTGDPSLDRPDHGARLAADERRAAQGEQAAALVPYAEYEVES